MAVAAALLCTDLAARGLDIPDVHWIVQFDAPQDPSAFVHRVGRTARMGRSGNALAYLMPCETSYVEFLRIRKVPLSESEAISDAPQCVLPTLRKLSESDRELMERGVKAFVSYVRGYKEHQCKFIFQLSELPMGRLARVFGLLQLPKMPEVRKSKHAKDGFTPSSVPPSSVPYKQNAREAQRQKQLQSALAVQDSSGQKQPVGKKVKQDAGQSVNKAADKKLPALKRRAQQDKDDYRELMDDYKMLKKLKKGKIDEDEFDEALQAFDHKLKQPPTAAAAASDAESSDTQHDDDDADADIAHASDDGAMPHGDISMPASDDVTRVRHRSSLVAASRAQSSGKKKRQKKRKKMKQRTA